MSESYTIQNSTIYSTVIDTTVSRFTRDTLINPHDAYMTVELYNNYYICMILHARSHMLQVLLWNAVNNNCIYS